MVIGTCMLREAVRFVNHEIISFGLIKALQAVGRARRLLAQRPQRSAIEDVDADDPWRLHLYPHLLFTFIMSATIRLASDSSRGSTISFVISLSTSSAS